MIGSRLLKYSAKPVAGILTIISTVTPGQRCTVRRQTDGLETPPVPRTGRLCQILNYGDAHTSIYKLPSALSILYLCCSDLSLLLYAGFLLLHVPGSTYMCLFYQSTTFLSSFHMTPEKYPLRSPTSSTSGTTPVVKLIGTRSTPHDLPVVCLNPSLDFQDSKWSGGSRRRAPR